MADTPEDPDKKPQSDSAPEEKPAAKKAPKGAARKAAGKETGENGPNVETLPPRAAFSFDPTFSVGYLDLLLERLRKVLSEDQYASLGRMAVKIAHYALIAAAALTVLCGLVALKFDGAGARLFGLSVLLGIVLLLLQYLGVKFLSAGQGLIDSTPTRLSSRGFLDCVALLAVLLGIVSLVGGIAQAIDMEAAAPFWRGLVAFLVALVFLWLALEPKMTNTKIEKTASAGEEAIGILSFFLKGYLKLVPIVFGVLILVGTAALLVVFFRTVGADSPLEVVRSFAEAYGLVAYGAAFPFIAFIVFLLLYLLLDLIRSVLVLPNKLDAIRK